MILKFHNGWNTWKYIDGISQPEVETVNEFLLAGRLGYTVVRIDEMALDAKLPVTSILPEGENWISLLNSIVPVSDIYLGNLDSVLFQRGEPPYYTETKQGPVITDSSIEPNKDGCLMLAITCIMDGVKHHIFTDCETYLLNDNGKTLNRLL
jgi:hypothetical protein